MKDRTPIEIASDTDRAAKLLAMAREDPERFKQYHGDVILLVEQLKQINQQFKNAV